MLNETKKAWVPAFAATMGKIGVLGAIALIAGSAAAKAPGPTPLRPADRVFSATLERTPCFGRCPVYRVTVSSDGLVRYHGERFVAVTGDRTAHVSPASVVRLRRLIERAGFMRLDERYIAHITDLPTRTVSVTLRGRTHTVVDYGGEHAGMPPIVTRIENEIDRTAGVARWVGSPGV